jgi:hypothetical protein
MEKRIALELVITGNTLKDFEEYTNAELFEEFATFYNLKNQREEFFVELKRVRPR